MSGRQGFVAPGSDAALRRCALTLHAVEAADRVWLLANLPESQRAELERLVGELSALGIQPDPGVARAALRHVAAAEPASAPASNSQTTDGTAGKNLLEAAPPVELARVLQNEPAALIAQVVVMAGPAAGNAILPYLNEPKRQQVKDRLVSAKAGERPAAPAPKLSGALLEQLSISLASGHGQMPIQPALQASPGWRSRLFGLVGIAR